MNEETRPKTDWSQFTLVKDAPYQSPVEINYKERIVSWTILVLIAVLIFYSSFRLWIKVRSKNTGWIRAAKALSALTIITPLLAVSIHQAGRHNIDEESWLVFIFLSLLPNALFWLSLWIADGFSMEN